VFHLRSDWPSAPSATKVVYQCNAEDGPTTYFRAGTTLPGSATLGGFLHAPREESVELSSPRLDHSLSAWRAPYPPEMSLRQVLRHTLGWFGREPEFAATCIPEWKQHVVLVMGACAARGHSKPASNPHRSMDFQAGDN
jgi:hypothetical protein